MGPHEKSKSKEAYLSLPLVYACSGCSSAAQLANTLAVRLDRERIAEMSCIVGVGGNVPSLVKTAQLPRKILVLDGCPLHCAKRCLSNHGISPTLHIDLSRGGVKKRFHEDATPQETDYAWQKIVLPVAMSLRGQRHEPEDKP